MTRTKIICTIGPASHTKTIIKRLIQSGMNAARINFSHGSYKNNLQLIKTIRAEAKSLNTTIPIIQDVQGPRIRLGVLPSEGVEIKKNEVFSLTTHGAFALKKNVKYVPIGYAHLPEIMHKGEAILVEDGAIALEVEKIADGAISVKSRANARLYSHKGINIPDTRFTRSVITKKDKEDILFGVSHHVEYIALSFAQSHKDIQKLRAYIKKFLPRGAAAPKIIAKIERPRAVQNIEKIIKASDAVMVARGDLGIETQAYKVPIIKKYIIDLCLARAKPVIVATQMLDSMIRNSRPTRAEVSDVAAAVIDHADALMLSGETASGAYPVESCRMMRDIIAETEKSPYDDLRYVNLPKKPSLEEAIAHATRMIVKEANARAVIGIALTGTLSRMLSRFRPEVPILIAVRNEREKREVMLSWGIIPFETYNTIPQEITGEIIAFIKKQKLAKKGEKIIILSESKKRAFQGGKFLINLQSM
ncbi:MAG: pyruvate kinase [Omnitrophica bacterium GWA2_50_21]|nr:MAG: pyruvate kinase [Omnitrophica bacterium GWA2_50_21]